jgi:hypothetical protein
MTDASVTSETPFYKVLEYLGEEVDLINKDMPEVVESVELTHTIELKNGIQVIVRVGRNIINEEEEL